MKSQKECNQRGAIMVEAAIYFPITIAIVMAVIYLGLFKMQESYFFFQVERAASELAREAAYPGYESFHGEEPLDGTRVDFGWEEPSSSDVSQYYKEYGGSISRIYRWGLDGKTKSRAEKYQEALCENSAILSLGKTRASVRINNSFFSKSVEAKVWFELPTPGILRFIGVDDNITLYAGAYQPVINTTDFVRNIDLAFDMGSFLLDKLGIEADKFLEKFNKITDVIF